MFWSFDYKFGTPYGGGKLRVWESFPSPARRDGNPFLSGSVSED